MKVKFVNIQGEITAIFPEEKADHKGNVMSYAHVGQHSACHPDWLNEPAIFDVDLYQELISIGYENLEVVGLPNILSLIESESESGEKRIFLF